MCKLVDLLNNNYYIGINGKIKGYKRTLCRERL